MIESGTGHTVKRLDLDLSHLASILADTGARVVADTRAALLAFRERDTEQVQGLLDLSHDIDGIRHRANIEIMQLLATWCPHGGDLRLVLSVHRGLADLERIADETMKIAGLVEARTAQDDVPDVVLAELDRMSALAITGLESVLEAVVTSHQTGAGQVIDSHRELHEEFKAGMRLLSAQITGKIRRAESDVAVLLLLEALERIGQHVRNLAEDAIPRARGEDGSGAV